MKESKINKTNFQLTLQAPLFLLGSFMQRRALKAYIKTKIKTGYIFEVNGENSFLGPEVFVNDCRQAIAKIHSEYNTTKEKPFVTKGLFVYPEDPQISCNCDHNYYNKYFSIPKDIYIDGANRITEYLKEINKISESIVPFRFLRWEIPFFPKTKLNKG
jgi:hypothetical protein